MPGLFALAEKVLDNPTLAVFAAFGPLVMMLFVDFGGPLRQRVAAQIALVLASAVLVVLGTLAAQVVWVAAVGTLVVSFAVLFVGVVSSVLAGATTTLLISFVLPVSLLGPVSSVPDRLAGWLLAGAASVIAVAFLWPAPTREPLRLATARACVLLARRLRAEVEVARDIFGPQRAELLRPASQQAADGVAALRRSFFGTFQRPTGLSTAARTLVRLVDQMVWLAAVIERTPSARPAPSTEAAVYEAKLASLTLLERGAELLESASGDPGRLAPDVRRLWQAHEALEQAVTTVIPQRPQLPQRPHGAAESRPAPEDASGARAAEFIGSLEPSFRAKEMGFAISAVAENIGLTVAARQRGWWQRVLGHHPADVASALMSARERAGAHLERDSVWLHNSLRGAVALSLAVLVARLTGVQHSFWVVFGTLAVLRSNAVNTGQTTVRALSGTVAGFIIGIALILAIGDHTTVFWVLLPVTVAFIGLEPAVTSFTGGQAGFTIVLLILFSIIQPAGLELGLARVEDMGIGCGVALLVGLLFWPRGAGSALGRTLSEALTESARYLGGAVAFGLTRCDQAVSAAPAPDEEARRAAAAAGRLDDAFREFLAERGTKHLSLEHVTGLVNAVAVVRLTADAVLRLWARQDPAAAGDRAAARQEILDVAAPLVTWFETTAHALTGPDRVPGRQERGADAEAAILGTVRRDLTGAGGRGHRDGGTGDLDR
ncbi:FUSC family protein [Streptomyces polygonati]